MGEQAEDIFSEICKAFPRYLVYLSKQVLGPFPSVLRGKMFSSTRSNKLPTGSRRLRDFYTIVLLFLPARSRFSGGVAYQSTVVAGHSVVLQEPVFYIFVDSPRDGVGTSGIIGKNT